MKRYILVIAFLYIALGAMCEMRVSSEDAQKAAIRYYQLINPDSKGEYHIGEPELFSLWTKAEMWFVPINDFWILVSTDKRTDPILAHFETREKPDLKSFPPAAQYLIQCYESEIAYARNSCLACPMNEKWDKQPQKMVSETQQTMSLPSYIPPLLGNLVWNQYGNESYPADCDKVYNKYCPTLLPFVSNQHPSLCGHAVVGCVAVAVGQIMRYWEWPYMADVPLVVGGILKQKRFYEWEKMPYSLYNYTPMDEVNMTTSFLRDLGYDLDMDYGTSSGASCENALNTFINYGYDETTLNIVYKSSDLIWSIILRSELAEGRPIFYAGYDGEENGHAFVVDGYNENGLFHANFGWGEGSHNTYYNLNSPLFDYPYDQLAIIGIQPDPYDFCDSAIISGPFNTPVTISGRWGIARAGSITFQNVTIDNTAICRVYSSAVIRLLAGTQIQEGSDVVFAIKNVPCAPSFFPAPYISAINSSTSNDRNIENMSVEYSIEITRYQASNIIRINSNAEIAFIEIYSMDGHCVIRSKQTELNISRLPTGVYIIRAQTDEGHILQTKYINSIK